MPHDQIKADLLRRLRFVNDMIREGRPTVTDKSRHLFMCMLGERDFLEDMIAKLDANPTE